MRLRVACFALIVIAGAARASSPSTAPPSSVNLLRLHPRAWRMPAAAPAGIRFEPETGAPADDVPPPGAAARVLQSVPVVRFGADGSRHAVVGGYLRHYLVATIDKDGRLVQTCVHGERQAAQRVAAGSQERPR